jgi:transposase
MYIHAVDTRAKGVTKADVAKEWGVNKNEYARLKNKLAESGTLETKAKSGRSRMLSRKDYLTLEKLNTKVRGDMTYEELAPKLSRALGYKVSATTIWRYAKRNGWRDVAKYTRPWLEDDHKKQRHAWAAKKLNEIRDGKDPWYCRIDIDEKMFRCFTAKRKTKKSPTDLEAESNGRVRVKSKTHIPQTMFLAAVAQPDKKNKFNGRIGIYRCAKPVPAKRKSRNRPAGTIEWKDYALTAETFMALLKEHVIPDAVKKMSWAPEIVIQMDNARAHTGSNLVKEVNDYGRTLKPPVRIELQPPNSPDTNLNDLCFFSSLASAVSKQHTPNPDILAKEVTRLFNTWHTTEKLTKLRV